jgi:hypothetical protein
MCSSVTMDRNNVKPIHRREEKEEFLASLISIRTLMSQSRDARHGTESKETTLLQDSADSVVLRIGQ